MKKFIFSIFAICLSTPSFANICGTQAVINESNQLLAYDTTLHELGNRVSCDVATNKNRMVGCDGKIYVCNTPKWQLVSKIPDCPKGWENASARNRGANTILNPTDEGNIYFFNVKLLENSFCKYTVDQCNKDIADCKKRGDLPTSCTICGPVGSITGATTNRVTVTANPLTPEQSEQMTMHGTPADACEYSGGVYRTNQCFCDSNNHLEPYEPENAKDYTICTCMRGYKRKNAKMDTNGNTTWYPEKDPCIPANDYEIKIERDDMAMQRDAEDAYHNEYDNAQSWANKGTTALSTLATGEGAMMAARAIAEKIADEDAEREMAEYVSTMKCEYGGGQSVKLGNPETLPGGNELANYYAEYKQLADKLKATKAALNLRPGIEAEVLYDRAETGLYQYQTAERQSGGFTSLSRALMNPDGTDATAWNAQRAETNRDLWVGGALATVGLAGSYIANRAINKDHVKKYKELEEKFNKIETKLLNKYPEAFVPEEIPVKPSIEEPIIDTIDEIDPIIEQTQPEPRLDFKPFSDKYLFASGSYKLKSNVAALDEYIQDVIDTLDKPEYADFKICIKIDGHTDRVPPKPGFMSNQKLSQKRAESVKDYMTTKLSSINSHISTMDANGHGEEQCTKDKYKKMDDANCRRIDITIEACGN